MNNGLWFSLAVVFLGVIVVAVTHGARRIDRLNTLLIKSRRTLEHALAARAAAAKDFAASGALDMAASLVLAESADDCLREGKTPLVDDGLDSIAPNNRAVPVEPTVQRCACESALSRVLRITVDELEMDISEAADGVDAYHVAHADSSTAHNHSNTLHNGDTHTHLPLTDAQKRLFFQLERARLDVRMARSFHNSHVDQVRRLRRSAIVRIFRLAGRAPVPQAIDIDDE